MADAVTRDAVTKDAVTKANILLMYNVYFADEYSCKQNTKEIVPTYEYKEIVPADEYSCKQFT